MCADRSAVATPDKGSKAKKERERYMYERGLSSNKLTFVLNIDNHHYLNNLVQNPLLNTLNLYINKELYLFKNIKKLTLSQTIILGNSRTLYNDKELHFWTCDQQACQGIQQCYKKKCFKPHWVNFTLFMHSKVKMTFSAQNKTSPKLQGWCTHVLSKGTDKKNGCTQVSWPSFHSSSPVDLSLTSQWIPSSVAFMSPPCKDSPYHFLTPDTTHTHTHTHWL